jgi:hypothetical protein
MIYFTHARMTGNRLSFKRPKLHMPLWEIVVDFVDFVLSHLLAETTRKKGRRRGGERRRRQGVVDG